MAKWFFAALAAAFSSVSSPLLAQSASFAAPSGNIVCYTQAFDYATDTALSPYRQPLICLIFEADWSLPEYYGDSDPTCDLDRTRTIVLPTEGKAEAYWSCHGDVFWPLPNPKITYGSDWSVGKMACSMRKDGVRCQNGAGGALHVRRSTFTLN